MYSFNNFIIVPSGAGAFPIFTRDYETNVSLGANATFTRTSNGTLVDFEGLVKTTPDNCARMQGARIVENLATALTTHSITVVSGNDYQVTIAGGNGDTCVLSNAISATLTANGTNRISFNSGTPQSAGSTTLTLTITGTMTEVQVEDVSGQSNQNPSEWVDFSTSHGLNANGVKAFATQNGITVNGSGVVTEAAGSAITGDIGLLLEAQATNAVTDSIDFSAWTANNVTFSSTTGPDGSTGDYLLTDDATSGVHRMYIGSINITSTNDYCASAYVKKGTHQYVAIRLWAESSGLSAYRWITFNFDTQAISESASINASGYESLDDSWYRVWFTYTAGSTLTSNMLVAFDDNATAQSENSTDPGAGGASYSGTGTTLAVFGAQHQPGTLPCSYISTDGGTATRQADALSYSGVATDNEVRYVADESYPFTTFVNVDVDDLDLSSGIPLDGMIKSINVYSPGGRPA